MFAIGIRYLMGWSMATHSADRERAEWPPHPDRVYMALASAHYETDGSDSEREALLWLERQGPPSMWASDANERSTHKVYVPVNDDSSPINKRARPWKLHPQVSLPVGRNRQDRMFPVAIPHDPRVYLVWPDTPPLEVRAGLESLCGKVIRVGHSASLVQAWVEDSPPEPNLIPAEGVAQHTLRVSGPGRLNHLAAQYRSGRRPERSRWVAYARAQPEAEPALPGGVFHERLLVLRRANGGRMGLESALTLANKLRNAVIKHCPEPVPEWVSGHTDDGNPSQEPHIAFLPLAFVGREHADGHLLGFALAVPKGIEQRGRELSSGQSPSCSVQYIILGKVSKMRPVCVKT